MSFHRFGESDPIPQQFFRQIPGVTPGVSAIHDEPKQHANLDYFLKAIVPSAKSRGVKMAIHPR